MLRESIPPLFPPGRDALASLPLNDLRLLEARLRAAPKCNLKDLVLFASELHRSRRASPVFGKLSHPLSKYALIRNPTFRDPRIVLSEISPERSSISESQILLHLTDIGNLVGGDVEQFSQSLHSIATGINFAKMEFRTGGVRTSSDTEGFSWQFPKPSQISTIISALHEFIAENYSFSPLLCAIVANVTLVCLHPYADGNGRLSRIVFNALLRPQGGSQEFYIPCKEIFMASRCGYEIRLRWTYINMNWAEIIDYFHRLIKSYLKLLKSHRQNAMSFQIEQQQ